MYIPLFLSAPIGGINTIVYIFFYNYTNPVQKNHQ